MPRILVVEDSKSQAETLRLILAPHGFDVVTANDGETALRRFAEGAFDLVLSDIVMPGMSGYELCRQIKSSPQAPGIPVVLLTALSDPRDIILGLESGADNFITKPVDPALLLERLHGLLEMRTGTRQHLPEGVEIYFMGQTFTITSEKEQILTLLVSTFEDTVRKNRELVESQSELSVAKARLEEYALELEDRIRQILVLDEELVQKNLELERQNRLVEEATRQKTHFLASMSHELRTPLNSIIGFAELLHDGVVGPLAEEHKEYMGDILKSARHLLRLINDVLDLARVESGKMDLQVEEVDVAMLVDEVRDLCRTLAHKKHITVTTEVAEDVGVVQADPSRLKQVLYNYLSNALKFTPPRGSVVVRARPEGPSAFRIEVQDTGVGISPQDLSKLFGEFQQVGPAAARREHEGTGLGLALTRKIVEAMGGQVGVTSQPGEGSMFYASIPRVAGSARTPRSEPEQPEAGRDQRLAGETILLVDDDQSNVRMLEVLLSAQGCHVCTAGSGAEAMASLKQIRPALILMDLHLPDGSGLDLTRQLKTDPATRDIPIVALTASAMKGDADRALEAGCDGYISKPIEARSLPSALAQHLR